jgi:hypothetical protein
MQLFGALNLRQVKAVKKIHPLEPTGSIENVPDLTDKKFPDNPTKPYRSKTSVYGCWLDYYLERALARTSQNNERWDSKTLRTRYLVNR